jgi:hypothetical protein
MKWLLLYLICGCLYLLFILYRKGRFDFDIGKGVPNHLMYPLAIGLWPIWFISRLIQTYERHINQPKRRKRSRV